MNPIRLAAVILLSLSPATSADDWPSFRGEFARGVADGQGLPETWGPGDGRNVRWSREIPGAGHGSPVVVGGRVFVTTAVTDGELEMVLGDQDAAMPKDTDREVSWRLYRLDAATGEIDWHREAYAGPPRATRHPKSSQANATPASNGQAVVAIFGSQGIVAYDFDGTDGSDHYLIYISWYMNTWN